MYPISSSHLVRRSVFVLVRVSYFIYLFLLQLGNWPMNEIAAIVDHYELNVKLDLIIVLSWNHYLHVDTFVDKQLRFF